MDDLLKTSVKRDFNRLGGALILSQILFLLVGYLVLLGQVHLLRMQHPFDSAQTLWDMANESGWMLILAAAVSAVPLLLLSIRMRRYEHIPDVSRSAGPARLLLFLLLLLGLQMAVVLVCSPLSAVMENAGYSFAEAEESASAMSTTGSMLFYSIAAAPICEELVYRGFVLRYLERYGRWFAVVISAALFALMHGNIVQFPIAFVAGLLFGYITVQYSIQLSILVHIGNNLFIEGMDRLALFDASLAYGIDGTVTLVSLIVLVVTVVARFPAFLAWVREGKGQPHAFQWFFSCWTVLLLAAYLVFTTLSSITFNG